MLVRVLTDGLRTAEMILFGSLDWHAASSAAATMIVLLMPPPGAMFLWADRTSYGWRADCFHQRSRRCSICGELEICGKERFSSGVFPASRFSHSLTSASALWK